MNRNGRRCALGVALVVFLGCVTAGAQVRDFEPVTDAMLENPDPADWLNWRRTLDGWGHSPLDQITTDQRASVATRVELGPWRGVPTNYAPRA